MYFNLKLKTVDFQFSLMTNDYNDILTNIIKDIHHEIHS